MNKWKQLLKKILIKLHLMKRPEPECAPKKVVPDFAMETRNEPEYIMAPGAYFAELDDNANPKIAIQIHAFFLDVMEEITEILNSMPYPYDCYISTDTEEKKEEISKILNEQCSIHYLQIDVMENRGRDVGPFLQQMAPVIRRYKYIAHLHTKKSKHTDFGDDWRHFLYRNMFGGRDCISAILEMFEKEEKLGLAVPEVYPIVRELMAWDNTKEDVEKLLGKMGLSASLPDNPMCPVGDIFWARTEAVRVLFEQGITQNDFQEEAGQLNYTLAHVIERIWCYLAEAQGYDYKVCINGIEPSVPDEKISRALIYKCGPAMTDAEYGHLRRLTECFAYSVIAVGSAEEQKRAAELTGAEVIVSQEDANCAVWKAVLEQKRARFSDMDEIALADDSGVGPLYDMRQIMDKMTKHDFSAWSVFKTKLSQAVFSCFNLKKAGLDDVIDMLQRDVELENAYVRESGYIGEWLFSEEPIKELAFDYIILHAPFITKESLEHLQKRKNERRLMEHFLKKTGFEK